MLTLYQTFRCSVDLYQVSRCSVDLVPNISMSCWLGTKYLPVLLTWYQISRCCGDVFTKYLGVVLTFLPNISMWCWPVTSNRALMLAGYQISTYNVTQLKNIKKWCWPVNNLYATIKLTYYQKFLSSLLWNFLFLLCIVILLTSYLISSAPF